MILDVSQIASVTQGAAWVADAADGVHFHRFTAEQEALYCDMKPDFHIKIVSTAGVRLEFVTDSPSLFFEVQYTFGTTRGYGLCEVFVNGEKIGHVGNADDEGCPLLEDGQFGSAADFPFCRYRSGVFSGTFALGPGEKTVRIEFPWSMVAVLRQMQLADGAILRPVKPARRMLIFGDSITHGYDALHPSQSYAVRLTRALGADARNKAIGGEYFFPELAAMKEDFTPDLITVAYGTNDWNAFDREKYTDQCRRFFKNLTAAYPGVPVWAVTPIWRYDWQETTVFGPFRETDAVIREQTADLPAVTVLDGFGFVPNDPAFFGDGQVHPNDKGFYEYFTHFLKGIDR